LPKEREKVKKLEAEIKLARDFEKARFEERNRRREEEAKLRDEETKAFLRQHELKKEEMATLEKEEDEREALSALKADEGHFLRVEEALRAKKRMQSEHVGFWDMQTEELNAKRQQVMRLF